MAMKVGILIDPLRTPLDAGLEIAEKCGVSGIQLATNNDATAPWRLSEEERARLRTKAAQKRIEISALVGDLGGHEFERASEARQRIRKTEQILELAVDLMAPVVTTHIGVVPTEHNAKYRTMVSALREVASYAGMKGVRVGIETGPESPQQIRQFIEEVGEESLGVNLDPANLVMIQGVDGVTAVRELKDFIVYSHAKDGRQYQPCAPQKIYDAFADQDTSFPFDDYFRELPIGQGDVDFEAYLAALKAAGYRGYLTIERETGDRWAADVSAAVEYLYRVLERIGER